MKATSVMPTPASVIAAHRLWITRLVAPKPTEKAAAAAMEAGIAVPALTPPTSKKANPGIANKAPCVLNRNISLN
ncbi:hypothetical protein NTCA1_52000 [Novosphingobium sp. TCA1]|nr:hypothetical protein NTCA1_52000 [Novosphingobium sp. TCA1]